MFNKKNYVTIKANEVNTSKLDVAGTATIGKVEAESVEALSGNFTKGIAINGTAINDPKWETVVINGKSYTVLVK